jgi:uncharacterized phage-associated protein
MRRYFKFNQKKTVEAILYITQKYADIYKTLKILYFADKEHISKWGRSITGDWYVAMKLGPVPSCAYDLVKGTRDEFNLGRSLEIEDFKANKYKISPARKPNMEMLSKSEIDCLNYSIQKYGKLSHDELVKVSHADPAYKNASLNDEISLEAIIDSLPNRDKLREYFRNI